MGFEPNKRSFETSFPQGIANPIPHDPVKGPWVSVAEANAGIGAGLRYRGMEVIIYDGATREPDNSFSGAFTEKVYWYFGGIADGDLVEKTVTGTVTIATAAEWTAKIPDINDYSTIVITSTFTVPAGTYDLKNCTLVLFKSLTLADDVVLENVYKITGTSKILSASTSNANKGKVVISNAIIDNAIITCGVEFVSGGFESRLVLQNYSNISELTGNFPISTFAQIRSDSGVFPKLAGVFSSLALHTSATHLNIPEPTETPTIGAAGNFYCFLGGNTITYFNGSGSPIAVGQFILHLGGGVKINDITDDELTGNFTGLISKTYSDRVQTINDPDDILDGYEYVGNIILTGTQLLDTSKIAITSNRYCNKLALTNNTGSDYTIVAGDGSVGSFDAAATIPASETYYFNLRKNAAGNLVYKQEGSGAGGGVSFPTADTSTAHNVSGALALNFNGVARHIVTLGADITSLTVSNIPQFPEFRILELVQDATGGRLVTIAVEPMGAGTSLETADNVDPDLSLVADSKSRWYLTKIGTTILKINSEGNVA